MRIFRYIKSHLFHTAAFHFRLGAFLKLCNLGDCPDPSCSDHGFCVEGSCVCRQGWRGPTCATVDHEARQCLPDCSGHGDFDLESQKCICKGQWTGNDCSKGNLLLNRKVSKIMRCFFFLSWSLLHVQTWEPELVSCVCPWYEPSL